MIGSTWNALFITMAMGAGMFAQQAAHKVSAGSEYKQVGSLAVLELFCSAEGYYLAGRFQGPVGVAELSDDALSSPLADEALLMAVTEGPPEAALESWKSPEPMELAMEAPIAPPELTVSAPTAEPPEREMVAETAAVAGSPAEPADSGPFPPELAVPALADGGMAEILPPPAPDMPLAVPGNSFDNLADDPSNGGASRSAERMPFPASIADFPRRTYADTAPSSESRYVSSSDLLRERAMARGEALRQRVETRKWLGVSPLRPTIGSTPYTTADEPQLLLVVPSTASRPRHLPGG